MIKTARILAIIIVCLLFQVTILPAYLEDPFQPNLLIILVTWLSLRETSGVGWLAAFTAGLAQDCFSGVYFGLYGFIYLLIYLMLRMMADVLYTDSRYLLVVVVFAATVVAGILQLVLLFLFSAAGGLYAVLLPSLFPQALVNALLASVVSSFVMTREGEEPQ